MEGFEQRSGADRLTFEKGSSGWCVEQSRGGPSLSLTGSCGESDGSRYRAEAGTRQEPAAPVQVRWWTRVRG